MKEIEIILAAEKEAQHLVEKAQQEAEKIVAQAKEEALTLLTEEKTKINAFFDQKIHQKLAVLEEEKKRIVQEAERTITQLEKKARKRMPDVEEFLLRKMV